MRQLQAHPVKSCSKYRLYSSSALTNAYKMVKETGMAIDTAARQYGVPPSTLRDRVKGRIDPETIQTGPQPLFSREEEVKLVKHIKSMADLGYGFTISEVVAKASDYAVFLKKRTPDKPLSVKWFIGFRGRWPELRVIKPRALAKVRAMSTPQQAITDYFKNLEIALLENSLLDKPECIFNIDEKGIQTEHAPPYIVSGRQKVPAITSSRSGITTIIGAGNALGTQVPPYFIFKGQRFNKDLLQGATTGSAATMSQSGWSNSFIFQEYLENHFIRYIQRSDPSQPIIILFDGHKSHVNIPIIEWAKRNNIILFVLPAHTSHVLQPLDVGCFGPLQKIYNNACHKFLREHPSSRITRYNIAALASRSYVSALSPANLASSFCKTGIFPYNKDIITLEAFKPSEPYLPPLNQSVESTGQTTKSTCITDYFRQVETLIDKKREYHANKSKRATLLNVSGREITNPGVTSEIFSKSKILVEQSSVLKLKKRKAFETPFKVPPKKPAPKQEVAKSSISPQPEPVPGPSHVNLLSDSDFDSDSSDVSEEEKCCVCNLFQPKELKNCLSLVFTKWAKCDFLGCNHWTHLIYCCKERVIRRNDSFICPCHPIANSEE